MRSLCRLVLLGAVVAALAGCGGTTKKTETETTPPPPKTISLRVYFLLHGKVQPVSRMVEKIPDAIGAAFTSMFAGPTKSEKALGLSDAMPTIQTWSFGRASDGALALKTAMLSRPALAQTVFTLTQFPAESAVYVNGKRYTRADFEDETPAILVESPLPFQTVVSPLRATGTANTFEATFQYDLVDPDGKVVKTHFVTATSGTGTRGTFDFTVPFSGVRGGLGKLVVYELSAKDGSRIHAVAIPIRLTP